MLPNKRAALELEPAAAAVGTVSTTMLVPTRSAGIRSGVNCTRLNFRSNAVGDGAHQQRLAEAGDALQEHVAAGDQGGQRALDDVVLADDDLADLVAEPAEVRAEGVELLFDRCGAHAVRPEVSCGGG